MDESGNDTCVTRKDGRYIDFGIHSFGMYPGLRQGLPGIADHDLISYDFETQLQEPKYRQRPLAKLNKTIKGTCETWDDRFQSSSFHDALATGDVDAAWF